MQAGNPQREASASFCRAVSSRLMADWAKQVDKWQQGKRNTLPIHACSAIKSNSERSGQAVNKFG